VDTKENLESQGQGLWYGVDTTQHQLDRKGVKKETVRTTLGNKTRIYHSIEIHEIYTNHLEHIWVLWIQ